MAGQVSRLAVLGAALAAASAIGALFWRAQCSTCGNYPEYVFVPGVSDEANAEVAYMWDVIKRDCERSDRMSEEHARYLLDHMAADADPYARKWAQGIFSSAMKDGVQIDSDLLQLFKNQLVQALDDKEPRMRISTIASIEEAGLLRDTEVRQAVQDLEQDPVSDVAWRVRRIDWTKEWNGGEGG